MSGKGSRQRPSQISEEELKRRWEAAFGKKEKPAAHPVSKDKTKK